MSLSSSYIFAPASRVGIWIFGSQGSVATTTKLGAAALASRMASTTGLVTELSQFDSVDLVPFEGMVFGGHDITSTASSKRAESLAEAGVFPPHLVSALGDALKDADDNLRPGYDRNSDETAVEAIARLSADITEFKERNNLEHVVAVNLSSVESPINANEDDIPASIVYALASIEADAAFVDFTPSAAMQSSEVRELAEQRRVPLAGRDGKTGETLVKSALAPMFANRNLRVRSWAGTNLLGGGDGATLADPKAASAKLASKNEILEAALGYPVNSPLHIDYIEDAGEWKTAWDHIAFEGFLGVRMTMQFTWHGCDSALAAPLVLDLVRLIELAQRRKQAGFVNELAFFFKDPGQGNPHGLDEQFHRLHTWAIGAHMLPPHL